MKKNLLFVLGLITCSTIGAQQIALDWAFTAVNNFTKSSRSVAVDANGNSYICGDFRGSIDFDPGTAINTISTISLSSGFVAKYAENGDYVWAKKLGSSEHVSSTAIGVDANGNVYITGYFYSSADFDPDDVDVFTLTSFGSWDSFVCKLDPTGDFIWAKQLGGTGNDQATGLTVGSDGSVYTIGIFDVSGDYNPDGVANEILTPFGSYDNYISKLDTDGNFVWAKQFGGTSNEKIYDIAVDATGNVYTTGNFQGTSDFNPDGVAANNLTSVGGYDAFVSKLDVNGNFSWIKQIGGNGDKYSNSIAVDNTGNVITTGTFNLPTDFDPDLVTTYSLAPTGNTDSFISILNNNGDFVMALNFGGATAAVFTRALAIDSDNNIYLTGFFSGTIDFNPSVVQTSNATAADQDLFISKINSSGIFEWNAQLISVGNAVATSLAVDNSFDVVSTGTFNGTIDFDPGAGNVDSTSFGSSNDLYLHKLVQCNLDVSVSLSGTTLTANQSGATYAWMDCNTFSTIGVTTQSLTPTSDGDYAVIITQGGCKDTSTCYSVVGVGINELSTTTLAVYPNPTNSNLTIETIETVNVISIYNSAGLLVQTEIKKTFSVENLPAGIYFLRVQTESGISTARFVKE